MKKIGMSVLLLILALSLLACNRRADIVIASKPMTEQFILVEMMMILIEQETDLTVEHKQGIGGGTSNIHPAMLKGDIDVYPEYTGTGWMQVLKEDFIGDPDALYTAVKAAYNREFNIRWMGLYGFNNGFGIAVRRDVADSLDLQTYSDLFDRGLHLVFAANYDFYEREDGYNSLSAAYGGAFEETREMQIGLTYTAIGAGEVDVIIVFTTDGRIDEHDLVVLEDDLNHFPSYYAATLVRNETLDAYPELLAVLEMLEGVISDADMTAMNHRVEIGGETPADVATDFLREKGLID